LRYILIYPSSANSINSDINEFVVASICS